MSEMIERVAKSLQQVRNKDGRAIVPPWEELNDDNREFWLTFARTAILAMREPTTTMLDAANEAVFHSGEPPAQADVVWQAMIGAALKE